MSTIYNIYKADYNPNSSYRYPDPLRVAFDQGNPQFNAYEPLTADGKFQRIVHRSVDHLYYRDFISNNKATFGSGNINKQDRSLEDQAWVISMPQSKFGEAIMPSSVNITMSYQMIPVTGTYSGSVLFGDWQVLDDGFGNLYVSASTFYSPYGDFVGGAFTNYTSSTTKPLVGEWPSNDVYQYINGGRVSFTSSFNKGLWPMESDFKDVQAVYLSGSTAGTLEEFDFLGAAWHFTASLSSSIRIKLGDVAGYNRNYNFQNSEFTIAMTIVPTRLPDTTKGSTLITKQGPVEELRVDENGNVYSQILPNKFPYKIVLSSEGSRKAHFQVSSGTELFALTSSAILFRDVINTVVVSKSGSLVTMWTHNKNTGLTVASGSCTIADRDVFNLSDIFVGSDFDGSSGFNGYIDNLKIYKKAFDTNDVRLYYSTVGVGNLSIGNVFYNHGMMTLTSIPAKFADVVSVDCRGTHTIWETEVSCTVGPGEFGMSCNPSLQEYSPTYNEFVYRPIVTGSYFKPYVTSIGLYDDYGNLLVIGKLSTPVQTPNNTDTTFIVKFDR